MIPKIYKEPTGMLFVILSVVLLRFGLASMDTTCLPSEEADALSEIGRKLGKDWDFDSNPCCGWVTPGNRTYENSVTCNNCEENGTICHVISISLKGQSLHGILPPELVHLGYLENIDLARNYLSGTIPQEWGSMQRILNISLLANHINGSIPKELGNISTLTTLNVEDNMMDGIIPKELGNLASIERLFLNSNYFTGEMPASFANLITMKEFRIGANNFSGRIPDYIGEWTSLESLRIQASGLEGPIPSSITLMASLTDLRISDLRGPDALCPPFSNMTSFKNLILRSCNLIGKLPNSIASNDLKVLDFSFNKLTGTIPNGFTALNQTDYIYLTGNLLSGSVPDWMLRGGDNIDLSYNNFTFQSSRDSSCQMRGTNLFDAFSNDGTFKEVSCLGDDIVCATNSTSLYINCGGRSLGVGDKQYEGDEDPGRPSGSYLARSRWGFSNTGHFLDDSYRSSYIVKNTSRISSNIPDLYMNARSSALSLTYYGFCMLKGSYNVRLHFAEIVFTNDTTYSSLGRRLFDIYIQGMLVEKDFDISDQGGGVGKEIVKKYTAYVNTTLEIRLYWAGKGTIDIPFQAVYGPLISAISVDANGPLRGNGNGVSGLIVIGIVVGAIFIIVLIVGFLWSRGYLGRRDTMLLISLNKIPLPPPLPTQLLGDTMEPELSGLKRNTGSFTLRQLKTATNNFDIANKIGEGGFGSVYKGVLPDGTLIAVKQLSSRSRQGNREFLNELGMISALQHPHLVKLHGCCIEGNQLLLAYEYMENNSLARALFGPKEWQMELDWPTRYRICIDIAKGLAFLHEESRLKIVHRDIKATNVLLDKNLNAKISDFGLAKLDEEDNTHISTRIAGTFGYMAPEYALRGYLTDKADVYSYGVVLLEIVSGMANTVDRTNQNHFLLLDQAIALKKSGDLMELVDPRLDSYFDIHEMMVVINIALVCTVISPTDRPIMSSVVRMLEERILPQAFVAEQSDSITEIDHDNMMKQLEKTSETEIEETSNRYTNFSVSDVDLYPVDRFSDYLQKRDIDANN